VEGWSGLVCAGGRGRYEGALGRVDACREAHGGERRL
jgi:hypothetical protein